MRRTRLKILPSRCVATLGFTLLLLACPTIAEEIVRPARFSETEASATHVHARVKNVPPEPFEVCKKGDNFPGAVISPQHREIFRTSSASSDLRCQLNKHGSLAGKNSSGRIPGDIAGNIETRVCDARGRISAVESMGLRRRSMEHSVNILSRRSRAAMENLRRSRINPFSVRTIGMREEPRCPDCDQRGGSNAQRRQQQRQQSNRMFLRRIDATSRTGDIKSQGRRYSEDQEASRRTRGLLVERNDRSISRHDYSSDRRMRAVRREIRTTKTTMLRDTPSEEVRADVRENSRLSERGARDSRMSGDRNSLESRKRSTSHLDRLVERRLPVQSRESLTSARSSRRARSVTDVRSDFREASRQSILQSVESRRVNTRSVPEYLSLTRRDTSASGVETIGSRGKDKMVTNTGAAIERSINGKQSIRTVSLMRQRRERDIFQASRRLFEGREDRDVRTTLERHSDRRYTLRRSESLASERRVRRSIQIDQLSDRRLPELRRDSSSLERATRRTRSITSVRSDIHDSSLRHSDFDVAERKIRRASSVDQISNRRPQLAAQETTAAERTGRRKRSVPNVNPGTRDTSRRSLLHSEDARRTHVLSLPVETHKNSRVRRDSTVPRVEISRSRVEERTTEIVRVPANELSGNQRMDIRKNSLSLQRRERDLFRASRGFVDEKRVTDVRAVVYRRSDRRDAVRRSESLTSERRVRRISPMDQISEPLLGSFHEPSFVDRTRSRSRSYSSLRPEFRDTSRRSQSYFSDLSRLNTRNMPEESSQASKVRQGTRVARVEISRSRGDEKKSLDRRSVIDISRSTSPLLQKRERDSVQAFRRSTEGKRVKDVQAAFKRSDDRRDILRRSDSVEADRRLITTSRIDQLSERRSSVLGRDSTAAEISVRRRWSISSVRSDIREASRRSYSADSRRTSIMSAQEGTYQASNSRGDANALKADIFGSRNNEKTSLARDRGTDISGNRRMGIRTISLSLKRREHDSTQSSRRLIDDQRAREARAVFKRTADGRSTLRRSESVGRDGRIRSTSRIDLISEHNSPMQVHGYTASEQLTRRIRSVPSVRADVRDISRRSLLFEIDSRRANTRSVSEETLQIFRVKRDTRASRVEIYGSRDQSQTTSGFRDAKKRSGNERHSFRRVYLSGKRQERVAHRVQRRFEDAVETRGVRPALDSYSERKVNLRRNEPLETDRRIISTPRLNQISGRRSPEREYELRVAPMMARRTKSLSNVRSDSRDGSRHSLYYADALHRIQPRSIPMELYQASSVGRDARFSKDAISRSRDNERISLVRDPAVEVSRSQRMEFRINALSLQRRERDTAHDSRRSTEVRDMRAVLERNSDQRNALRRSEYLGSDGRMGSISRIGQSSERRLLGRDSTLTERTTRKTRSVPNIRSDILDASRRSHSIDSRRTNVRSVREDSYLAPSAGRDTRVNRADISRSNERIPLASTPATEIARNRQTGIRTKPSSPHRREREMAQASRRYAENQMARDDRAKIERYADRRETLSRSESLRSDRRTRSTSRIDQSAERRLIALGRDSVTTERAIRKTRSVPNIRSDILDASRRSHSIDSRRTNVRSVREDSYLAPSAGRDTRVNRADISRSNERIPLASTPATEIARNRQTGIRTKPSSPHRREREMAQVSRRYAENQMARDDRAKIERYADRRETLSRSESLRSDRRTRSTSRIDQSAEHRLIALGRDSAMTERAIRKTRSVPNIRSDILDASRRSHSIDSRRTNVRSVREDSYLAPSAGRETRVNRADISRYNERIPLAGGPATEIARNRQTSIRTKPSSPHRREREMAQASRRYAENQMARDERPKIERYADRRETLSRSESLRSDRRTRSTSRIDQSAERRLIALGRDSATTERPIRRTRSVPSGPFSIRESSRRSSLYSAESGRTSSVFLADDLSEVPRETKESRVENSRSLGDDRASHNRIQAAEVSRKEQIYAKPNKLSLQRRERDSALASRRLADNQMVREVRSAFGRYSDRRDVLRRSESLGPERRIRSTSRNNQLSGRRSYVVDRESAAAERNARRGRSVSTVRSGTREIYRWTILDSVDSRIKDSRSRIQQSLPVQMREDGLGPAIFRSRLERGYLASRDRSEGKVRTASAKGDITTVESIIRRVNTQSGVKFNERHVYRLPELKLGVSLRIYSPLERREGSNGPNFRRDDQELRLTVTTPRNGEYEKGKKLTGARRLSLRFQPAIVQQRAREVSRESLLRRRDLTSERADRHHAPGYRQDERNTRMMETVTRKTARGFGRRSADEDAGDNRRVMFRYRSTSTERQVREENQVARRIAGKSGTQVVKSGHRSERSQVLAVVRPIDFIQETVNLASDSSDSRENLKSLGLALDPANSSSGKQSENYQLLNHVMKYFLTEKMASLVPAIQSLATSAAAIASMYLPDQYFNAIMLSNEFVPLNNGYEPISSGNLTKDSPAIAASSLWTFLNLPEVNSYENKVAEVDMSNMKSVVRGRSDGYNLNEKTKVLMQGPNDDPSFNSMLHPKMTNDEGLFSMTIGGCIAALAMSVSTK